MLFIVVFLQYCNITNLYRRILSVDTVQENFLMGVERVLPDYHT